MSKLVVETIENAAGTNPLNVLMTENTTTGGTSIAFTSIPSGVSVVHLSFKGLSTAGSSSVIIVQLGDSGGFETTGYAGSSWSANTTNDLHNNGGFVLVANTNIANTHEGSITFRLMNTSNLWQGVMTGGFSNTNAINAGAGNKALSGELDRIQITTEGGSDTFDANGGVNVRYEY